MKKETGITLVALIITIIVLLILATVSISLVMNGGIIDRADKAVKAYSESEIGEQIKLAYFECQAEKLQSSNINEEEFIRDSLREKLNDNNLTATVKNGKITVNTTVKGEPKTYIFKSSTGESYEYKDPFDYGGKTKNDLAPGDDITLGTEKFKVFYNQNGVIKAMPFYNLVTVTADGTVKQGPAIEGESTEISSPFSTTNYWTVGDDSIDMDDSRNKIQQYILAYERTIDKLVMSEITVKVAQYSELNTSGITNIMRNPGQNGLFCLGSSYPNDASRIWFVDGKGNINYDCTYGYGIGVRPIIIIEY